MEKVCFISFSDADASVHHTLDTWQTAYPELGVLALLPEGEQSNLPILQMACRERGIPLFGGLFPALLNQDGRQQQGAWLLCFPRQPAAFMLPLTSDDALHNASVIAAAANTALAQLPLAPPEVGTPVGTQATLFLIFDGLIANIASILDELYLHLADQVHYAGANAGSESFQAIPCLFNEHEVIAHGVLGFLLTEQTNPVLANGISPSESVMSATATLGNCIQSIDWRPAFTVYQEIIQRDYGIALTHDNFYHYAVHYPLGIVLANGDVVVRFPVAINAEGAVCCVGEVPENAMLVLLKAPEVGNPTCITQLHDSLQARYPQAVAGRDMLCFYCAGRALHFGAAAATEFQQLQIQSQVRQLAGVLSLGEIGNAQAWGYPLFHNAALLCLPW